MLHSLLLHLLGILQVQILVSATYALKSQMAIFISKLTSWHYLTGNENIISVLG